MNSKTLEKVVLTFVMVFGLALQARADEIKITVEVDETTAGDLELIETAVTALEDGAEISKSLRRTTMGVVGELQLLLGKRIDDSGYLTRDDGTVIGLLEGDRISVAATPTPDDPGGTGNAHVTVKCVDWQCRQVRPVCVAVGPLGVQVTFQLRVAMAVPPARVSRCYFTDPSCSNPCGMM